MEIEKINTDYQNFLNDYLHNCQQLNKSEHTLKNYRADLHKFLIWYQDTHRNRLYKIKGVSIGLYKDFLSSGGELKQKRTFWQKVLKKDIKRRVLYTQRPLAVASRKRHLSSVKNFFEYLKEYHEDRRRKLFQLNPVKPKIHGIKLKDVDMTPTPLLRREDWVRIQEKTWRTEERLLIFLLYYGGLRLSEVTKLRFEQFDCETKTLTFDRKGGSVHRLKIRRWPLIYKQIEFLLQAKPQAVFLFSNSKEKALSTKSIYNLIIKMIKRAGVTGVTPHSFRKACATNLYRQTRDLLKVRDYLNHKDAKVTQSYIQLD